MAYQEIIYEKEGNIGVITLNRPPMNALTGLMQEEMNDALGDASKDPGVRALILTGAGDRAFSAGLDFTHLQRISKGEETIARPTLQAEGGGGGNAFVQKLYYLEKPTFAALNGVVAVGSNGLWLACDIRIASDKARIALNFFARALTPHFGASWLLPRILGEARALEVFYNYDQIINAEEALRLGLVSHVVPHAELMKFTKEYATRIASGPPLTLGYTKREIRRAYINTMPMAMDYEITLNNLCHQTEDFKEAVAAFSQKRAPKFQGR